MDVRQRRARLGVRHALATKVDTVEQVADAVVALHATDLPTVHLSVAARTNADDVERALYDDRTVVRMLGMRRTMFVVPAVLVPVVQEACTREVAVRLRKGLVKDIAEVGRSGEWLAELEDAVVAALAEKGEAFAAELSAAEPRLRTEITYAPGKSYGGTGYITNRVLGLVAAEGRIVRGRPRGSWLSGQYAWSTIESWLPGIASWTVEAARAELARRWLWAYGPAPMSDLKWWAGWTVAQTRKALADVGAVEVDGLAALAGDGGADDGADDGGVGEPEPWAALLPALDPTPMGWRNRDWFLDPAYRPLLFDRSGNVGPTVWCDGRVVGGWAQRASGEVVVRLLADVGTAATDMITAEARRVETWLGDTRVTPKFRTPLEKELSA
ncbi:winged helix DNA-binding domain-containing protein [Kibdelosporangium lantanae]